jgi:antitoxin component of MazEF toxin-antitoxin module
MREFYVIGPYQLGSKTGKSWVVGIPAEVAKVLQISSSTLFSLRIHKDTRSITLQEISELIEKYNKTVLQHDKNLMGSGSGVAANIQ